MLLVIFMKSNLNQIFFLTHKSPKCLEWNLAEEKLKEIFTLKYAIFSFKECLDNKISGSQRSDMF